MAPSRRFRKLARKAEQRVRAGGFAHRLLTITGQRRRWYDWGHRLMVLVGEYRHGEYGTPRGRDLWYHDLPTGKFLTTYDYADVRRDRNAEWKVFDVQDDGHTVKLGWWGDHITFQEMSRPELRLFRRWDFWECRARGEWFGIRRWLYYRGLHAAVHLKVPFTCQATPPHGSGGYSHWYCEVRGKHDTHRFRNYTWTGSQVAYEPVAV